MKPADVAAAIAARRAGQWPKATSAEARAWSATGSKAASALRRASWVRAGGYTVGVLVQCNCGARRQLLDRGRAGGEEIVRDQTRAAPACAAVPRRRRVDHYSGGHRCATAAAPDEAAGAPGGAWGWRGRDRLPATGPAISSSPSRLRTPTRRRAKGRSASRCCPTMDESDVRGDCAGDRGGYRQRHGGRRDDERRARVTR